MGGHAAGDLIGSGFGVLDEVGELEGFLVEDNLSGTTELLLEVEDGG